MGIESKNPDNFVTSERSLLRCYVLTRLLVLILQVFLSLLPDHDADAFRPPSLPSVGLLDSLISFTLRGYKKWDSVYFCFIARWGYVYEQTLAFFPLLPAVLSLLSRPVHTVLHNALSLDTTILLLGVTVNQLCGALIIIQLYRLSLRVIGSPSVSYFSAILFCINPALVFFSCVYSESLFFLLTLLALQAYEQRQLFRATFLFALTTVCRSNGLINLGYIGYAAWCATFLSNLIWSEETIQSTRKSLLNLLSRSLRWWYSLLFTPFPYIFLCAFGVAPLLFFQAYAYHVYCREASVEAPSWQLLMPEPTDAILHHGLRSSYRFPLWITVRYLNLTVPSSPDWCFNDPPFSYLHIQKVFWNVGFLAYYEWKQWPNFLLALPVIVLALSCASSFYSCAPNAYKTLGLRAESAHTRRLVPYVFHLLFLAVYGVTHVNVQVLTRIVFSSCPVIYWFCAHQLMDCPSWSPDNYSPRTCSRSALSHDETSLVDSLLFGIRCRRLCVTCQIPPMDLSWMILATSSRHRAVITLSLCSYHRYAYPFDSNLVPYSAPCTTFTVTFLAFLWFRATTLSQKCNHRSQKHFSKHAYEKGIVIIRCDGCQNLHLIADNLGWIVDGHWKIEDVIKVDRGPISNWKVSCQAHWYYTPRHTLPMVSNPGSGLDDLKKKHRPRSSGRKGDKKRSKGESLPRNNVKAFAVQHTTKAARLVQRTLDYRTRGHHLPLKEHVVDAAPPVVVAIVGPPKSGKSTLLRSLVKHFTHQAINVIKGPLTVVVGKKIRLSFIECGCDINSMLDAAKIADVVLMMVNVRAGLEMYHFEFINIMQVHGLPRIVPVLNHLDTYKDSSSSRAIRRKIKQRLWVDLNSKIFLLTRFQPKRYPTYEVAANKYSKPGEYLLAEVRRLARMIVVKIPRLTDWRTSHPYLLIDRLEDITDSSLVAASPEVDRSISMYGWVRGAPIPPALTSPGVHIAGLGDFTLADCMRQPDPCPLPSQLSKMEEGKARGKTNRHLAERDRKIYAPMSSLGGVLFDRDATYIDLGGSHYLSNRTKNGKSLPVSKMATQTALDEVHFMLNEAGGIDQQLDTEYRVRMLKDAPYLTSGDVNDDADIDELMNSESKADQTDDVNTNADYAGEPDIPSATDARIFSDRLVAGFLVPADSQPVEKPKVTAKQRSSSQAVHLEIKEVLDDIDWRSVTTSRVNWNRVIYGDDNKTNTLVAPQQVATPIAGGLLLRGSSQRTLIDLDHDYTLPLHVESPGTDWTKSGMLERIANRFTTGQWDPTEDAQTLLQSDAKARALLSSEDATKHAVASTARVQHKPDAQGISADASEESGAEHASDGDSNIDPDDDDGDVFHDSGNETDSSVDGAVVGNDKNEEDDPNAEFEKRLLRPTKRQKLLEKRQKHKALFNKLYEAAGGGSDSTVFYDKLVAAKEAQLAANRAVLQTLPPEAVEQLEGFPPGAYVRLEFKGVPHQFVQQFDPCQPLVVGVLPSTEESNGHIQVRFRVHRWLKRALRSNDPLTVSIGWRRYQTVGIFSKEEHNLRNRYLKYCLPHEHCLVTIYGPLVPAKTGVVFFVNSAWRPQADSSDLPSFRVAGTGVVTTTDQSFSIMKKLKLVGEPFKIFAKTSFIRGMFNSSLEVSKMIGSRIQTVSNIRGLIKAALTNTTVAQPGDFRATFEAPIGKADLVFLRTFVAVGIPKYYNPVLNRLCAIEGEHTKNTGKHGWRLLRTLQELRKEAGEKPEFRSDSQYKPIHRPVYVPPPLFVPTKLVAALPFAHKPKPSKRAARHMLGGDPVRSALSTELPPPVRSADDRNGETPEDLLIRLRQLHADFKQRQREKMVKRVTKHKQELAKQEKRRLANQRQKRKSFFARQGNKAGRSKHDRSED
ncbi:unnamed protein product [Dicrocoelium dendriticum]|nr:unnamed protein product [Dicrocoelium dendriticum]